MPRQLEELIGEFDRIVRKYDGPDGKIKVLPALLEDGTKLVGYCREDDLECGLTYRFSGFWNDDPKYGKQFNFQFLTLHEPSGRRGTIAYLQRGPGIGAKRAAMIWQAFGSDSLAQLRDNPDAVSAAVSGLTPEKAREASAYFLQHKAMEAVSTELLELGLNRRQIEWAIGEHGTAAARVLRENMYALMACKGTGFASADRLYLAAGGDPAAVHRVGWCCWNALNRDTEGHTWRPLGFCLDRVGKELAGCDSDIQAGIEWAKTERKIVLQETASGSKLASTFARARAESVVAAEIHRAEVDSDCRWRAPQIVAADQAKGEKGPTIHQVEAIAAATGGPIGILAGRPGTGKTFSLAQIIRRCRSKIAVCAPTGKAAVRISESLNRAGVHGTKARTIHSLLKMGPDGEPEYRRDNPLSQELDLIAVDEASMIDTTLMAHLLDARGDAAVLFCGDPGQLSPVGHGAPLRDMMAIGAPCGMLTEIQRNSGRIVQACRDIAERNTFTPSENIDLEHGENFGWIEAVSPEIQVERLKGIFEKLSGRGYDPIRGCQVIVAVNERGDISRKKLNDLLQVHLNPNGQQAKGNRFRVGDKIINTENGAAIAEPRNQPEADANGRVRVANGEQAIVVEVAPRYTVAEMEYPRRRVKLPHGEYQDGDGENGADDKGDNPASKWQLAYAITLHKAQGSDWPVVIPMIDQTQVGRVCKREWPYTAFSRAKELCIGIGRLSVAREMCRTSGLADRRTCLVEAVEELRVEAMGRKWEEDLRDLVC